MIKTQAEEMKKAETPLLLDSNYKSGKTPGKLFREMPYNPKSAQARDHQDLASLDRKEKYACYVCNVDHIFQLQRGRGGGA